VCASCFLAFIIYYAKYVIFIKYIKGRQKKEKGKRKSFKRLLWDTSNLFIIVLPSKLNKNKFITLVVLLPDIRHPDVGKYLSLNPTLFHLTKVLTSSR
jgi:hypothetical protein